MSEILALRKFIHHYLVAVVDRTEDDLHVLGRKGAFAIARCVTILALAVVFAIYFILGLVGGLKEAFGREWLGQLTTGAGGLFALVVATRIKWKNSDRRREIKRAQKYDQHEQVRNELIEHSREFAGE